MTAPQVDAVAALGGTRLFASLPDDEVAGLAAAASVRTVPASGTVFAQGDPADGLVVVVRGRVKVALRSRDGAELMLRLVGAGSTLGEPSVADGGVRSATVTALTDSVLLVVPGPLVLDVAGRHPAVARQLLASLAGLVRRLSDEYGDVVFLDVRRRVAKLLLSHTQDGRVSLDVTQAALASMVGGSRQAVNAALGSLEKRGWIRRDHRVVVLDDEDALRRFSQG